MKTWQIKKGDGDTGPSPGQYDTSTAIQKTQWTIKSPPKKWGEARVCLFQ